jgi:hypothetical protein
MEVFPQPSAHKTNFELNIMQLTKCHPRTSGERRRMMKRIGTHARSLVGVLCGAYSYLACRS